MNKLDIAIALFVIWCGISAICTGMYAIWQESLLREREE